MIHMKFIIVGRNIEVTPGLRAAVEEKIGKLDVGSAANTAGKTGNAVNSAMQTVREEALQALEVLGYNKAQAAKAVDKLLADNPDQKVETIVKAAFRML